MTETPERKPIRMNLHARRIQDFLNESLRAAQDAEARTARLEVRNPAHRPGHRASCLRHGCRRSILPWIYENVDRRGKAPSRSSWAVERIISLARVELTPREKRALRRAQKFRDPIVHFEFEIYEYEVKVGLRAAIRVPDAIP